MATNFASPPARQLFSVPYDFILYMTENPTSARGFENLQQTCKFFFAKNQCLISYFLVCSEKGFSNQNNAVKKTKAKFWAPYYLSLQQNFEPSKFFRISAKVLHIDKVILSRHEFDLLVVENTIKRFHFSNYKIENATVDQVLEKLPAATVFWYKNPEEIYSVETLLKLNSIQRLPKLTSCGFQISKLEGFLDTNLPSLFLKFMLQNSTSTSGFFFRFGPLAFQLKTKFLATFQKWSVENPDIFDVWTFPFDFSVTFKNYKDYFKILKYK